MPETLEFPATESGLVDLLVQERKGSLYYCEALDDWLVYAGRYWSLGAAGDVQLHLKNLLREEEDCCIGPPYRDRKKALLRLESRAALRNVLELAKGDYRLGVN